MSKFEPTIKGPIDLIRQQFQYIENGVDLREPTQIPASSSGGKARKAPPPPPLDKKKKLELKADYLKREFEGFAHDPQPTRKNFLMSIKQLSSSAIPEEKDIAALALSKIGKIAQDSGNTEVKELAEELITYHELQMGHYNASELTTAVKGIAPGHRAMNITDNYFTPKERLSKEDQQKFEARADHLAYQFLKYSENPDTANKDFIKTIKSLSSSDSKENKYLSALALDKIEMISRYHKNDTVKQCYSDLMADHRKLETKGYEKLEEQGFGTHDYFHNFNYGSEETPKYSPAVTEESTLQYQNRYEGYPLETKLARLQYYKRDLYKAAEESLGTQNENEFPTSSKIIYHARCESMDALALLEINAKKVASEGLTLDLKRDIKRDVSIVLKKHSSPEEQKLLNKHMDYLIEKEMKEAGVSSSIQKTKLEGVKEFFSGIFNAKGRNKAAEILASKGLKISSFVEKEKAKIADSPAQHGK